MKEIPELRCARCGRLLAKGTAVSLQIKCRGCKTINHFQHGHEPSNPNASERQETWHHGNR